MRTEIKTYDVVIIGGGVIGTSIARELSRYKIDVALLEKEIELAFGVSKSNSGIIHPGTQNLPGSLKGRLCVQGNILTRRIAKELGVEFQEVGELIVAFNKEENSRLFELKKEAETMGVPGLRIVGGDWLRENEPNLNGEAIAALYAPTAGIISPYRLVYALAENAVKNGVEIHVLTAVEGIKFLKDDKYKFDVITSRGVFRARFIINAAGLYADKIASMAGVSDLKITPRKGEEFILDKKKENLTRHLLFPLPSKTSKGILVTRTSDGNPMIGPTVQDVEDKEDLLTSDEGYKKVVSAARRLVPSINKNDIITYFAGLRPVCGDDFIVRHENNVPGFVNVVGIQSPGLTAAPAIAGMVKKILENNGLDMKKKFFFKRYQGKVTHLFSKSLYKIKKLVKRDHAYGDILCRCEMVSVKEVKDAIKRGARTMDGIKFRTRAQGGRCHGGFCTTRIMKILAEETNVPITELTKRGAGSEIVKEERGND
ncbi:MAG: NAD(P)/FAD-dependent oxidoreductase [Candidatus Omnitrophica bacterium]|nr:NAD(P)/FAD-dependent oxidoreductase [Candidatus Omnitrophota bacterium]